MLDSLLKPHLIRWGFFVCSGSWCDFTEGSVLIRELFFMGQKEKNEVC